MMFCPFQAHLSHKNPSSFWWGFLKCSTWEAPFQNPATWKGHSQALWATVSTKLLADHKHQMPTPVTWAVHLEQLSPIKFFRGSKFLLTSHGAELPRWAQSTNRIKRDNKVVFYCYHSKCSGLKQHKFIILEFCRSEVIHLGTSLVVQWLRLWAPNEGRLDSTPGWGTKIPHAVCPIIKLNN